MHSNCFIKKEQEACLDTIQKLTAAMTVNGSSPGTCWNPSQMTSFLSFQISNSAKSVKSCRITKSVRKIIRGDHHGAQHSCC
ncbi:ADCYAP1R1: Pituitary adenylate cyclase-activating polypeptide type I receptor [Crotalus adamanteus]|uniref:ADCYAP1R1: Pituitary adenylate cyclase-activating polypeptide type I receptor n=1 Tax=Crotalus adamanteus TaxID=8729 RepID=A0AAW1B2L6_CROAD